MSDFMIFVTLFYEYFKIGLFTIGGGYAMLPVVMQVVQTRGWLTPDQLMNFIGISESTSGPFAINLATFVGLELGGSTTLGVFGGLLGAVVATFAVVLPSLIIIMLVTNVIVKFNNNQYIQGALRGIRPVIVGLITSTVLLLIAKVILPTFDFKNLSNSSVEVFNYTSLTMFAVLLTLSRIKIKQHKIHPILLILLSAIMGIILFGYLEVHR